MQKRNLYPMRLKPVYKDIIWGGTRLITDFHKDDCTTPRLAESWELTVHPDGMSVIADGEYAGMTLGEYLGCGYDFPVLIKFIDANDRLSVQVHPAKTELWYIVDAQPGAQIIYGLEHDFDEASFRRALADGTLDSLLHRIDVHPGEFYMLPSGLIHAIGSGILIAEFQQSSNITYRVYDYNRGREIHTEQAIDTIKKLGISSYTPGPTSCEFFSVKKTVLTGGQTAETVADKTFVHLLCIDGEGTVDGYPMRRGDSYFIPAGYGAAVLKTDTSLSVIETLPPQGK